MNASIVTDPCPRCQRREAVNNAYAEAIVSLETELADERADNKTLSETLSASLDQLHITTKTLDRTRTQLYRLVEQVRASRPRPEPRRAA
jgi:methylphosphotriester-DNA--protein-cysteine methyltransferase